MTAAIPYTPVEVTSDPDRPDTPRPTTSRTRLLLDPADPRHGRVAGYSAGCHDACCRADQAAYARTRRRRLGYQTWMPWVDAEPVRAHLHMLKQHGIGRIHAARLAGIHPAAVRGIVYGHGHGPVRKCRPHTAAAILAVRPTLDNLPDRALVPATGPQRLLRSLVALGHTVLDLAPGMALHPDTLRRLLNSGDPQLRCSARTARAARALYTALWQAPAARGRYDELVQLRPHGWVHDRARRMAASRGWAPPGAWDDDTIDDPTAQPMYGALADSAPDLVAIERVLGGEQVPLTNLDIRHAVQVGSRRGMGVTTVAARLGRAPRTVQRHIALIRPA